MTGTTSGILSITGTSFTTSASGVNGGLFFMDGNNALTITETNVVMTYLSAVQNGGGFFINNAGTTTMTMQGTTPVSYSTAG